MSDNQDSSKHRRRGLMLALAAALLGGLVVARRVAAPQRMPFAGLWQRALAEKRGTAEAQRLIAAAEDRYRELYDGRPRPASRVLRFHVERITLPGLALYQTLLEAGDDQETALTMMDALCAETVTGFRRLMAFLSHLPRTFAMLRRIGPWVVRFGFPAQGWEMELLESSEDCAGFNMHRCFYLDTLTSYGAPELTRSICGGDDVVFPALAPAIIFERTTTMGRGGDRCDFRWRPGAPQR